MAAGDGIRSLAHQIPDRMAVFARLAPVINAVDQRLGEPQPAIAGARR